MAITTDPLVQAISAQLPSVDDETVTAVLNALEAVKSGAAVGTICTNAEGDIAVRVSDAGVTLWRVTATNGSTWTESAPNLDGWTVIKEGAASE